MMYLRFRARQLEDNSCLSGPPGPRLPLALIALAWGALMQYSGAAMSVMHLLQTSHPERDHTYSALQGGTAF